MRNLRGAMRVCILDSLQVHSRHEINFVGCADSVYCIVIYIAALSTYYLLTHQVANTTIVTVGLV